MTTHWMCGLSTGDTNQHYADIDYAIYLTSARTVLVYESGGYRGEYGTYGAGDRFGVSIEGSTVKYSKNGRVFYTHTTQVQYPLVADTSFGSGGATITNAVMRRGGAESTTGGNATRGANIQWLVSDQLGTPRMVLDQTGSLTGVKRHDYLPFGEELGAGVGGRTINQGYSGNDNVRQKFSGKERDSETGLDYFLTRYYASAQGRFTSYDPIFVTAKRLVDPQRLNLCAYARNNPLKFIDPDGMDVVLTAKNEEEARKRYNIFLLGLRAEDRKHVQFFVGAGKNGYKKGEFYILADKKHKSDSENFQGIQKAANDRTALGRITVLKNGDTYTLRYFSGDVKKPTLETVSGTFKHGDFHGYTFFEYRGKDVGENLSRGNFTEAYVDGELDEVELSATMHHELRAHILLGDFGRTVPKARHSDAYARGQGQPTTEADLVGERAEKEARANAQKKP